MSAATQIRVGPVDGSSGRLGRRPFSRGSGSANLRGIDEDSDIREEATQMGGLWQDIRFGVRRMRREWLVTAVAVGSLAIAIGGNAAVFSLVDAFLFRPLPVDAPERVVLLSERRKDQPTLAGTFAVSLPTWADLADRARTLNGWGALQNRVFSVRGPERSDAVTGAAVTQGFLAVLGVDPARGRIFRPEEGVPGGPGVVIVSREYADDRFGADADPLGRTLVIDGEPRQIVGVLPAGFQFLIPDLDLWVPHTDPPTEADRDARGLTAVARMAAGATMESVSAELAALAADLELEYPEEQRGWTVDAFNLRTDIPTRQTRILFGLLQGIVALVLVIACANIANLLLAKGQQRTHEIALRTVLGANRGRVVRQLLTESSAMVTIGAAGGLLLAWAGIEIMSAQFAPVLPSNFDPRLDARVLLLTLVLTVVAAFTAGLAPALQTFRASHSGALREGGRSGVGRRRKRLSRALVVVEIALSFVALGGGGLLVRSFLDLQSGDPGFEVADMLTAAVAYPPSRIQAEDERADFQARVLARARQVPGVTAAALTNAIPRGFGTPSDSIRVVGRDVEGAPAARVTVLRASDGFAAAIGLPVLSGRFFETADDLDAPPVAVVSASVARSRWPDASPLGERIWVGGTVREVVGVVGDVEPLVTAAGASASAVYVPAAQSDRGASILLVRTMGDPRGVAEPLRMAFTRMDPDLTLAQVRTYEEFLEQAFTGIRVFNTILGGFGLLAILLASIGTYGVLAFSVEQRRREIGVRRAVGAGTPGVVWIFFRQGVVLGAIGLGLGAAMTLPLIGLVRAVVSGLSTVQPSSLAVVGAVLLSVTLAASFLPAWSASRVDPMRTLRDE